LRAIGIGEAFADTPAAGILRTAGSTAAIGILIAANAGSPATGGIGVARREQTHRAGQHPAEKSTTRSVGSKRPRETIESCTVHCRPFPRYALFLRDRKYPVDDMAEPPGCQRKISEIIRTNWSRFIPIKLGIDLPVTGVVGDLAHTVMLRVLKPARHNRARIGSGKSGA
jgi:hypothetical protein